MNDREPPGYDDWFDEPEPPTLESGRSGRASYDIPAETEEDVWTLPEDEPRRQRRNAAGEIDLFGVALTKNQIAIIAVAALALFIAILAALNVFGGGTPAPAPLTTTTFKQPTTTAPTTTTPTLALPTTVPIQSGDTGQQVKLLQKALIQLQFLQPPNKADGSFGLATKTAVEDFQSANGLTVDGVFGAASLTKLRQVLGG